MVNTVLALASAPNWITWLGVIPLFAALGAVIGNFLDVWGVPMPPGYSGDWTKLMGAVFGSVGVGIVIGAATR